MVVWVGLISYGLYLWHSNLMTFTADAASRGARWVPNWFGSGFGNMNMLAMLAVGFGLGGLAGAISWYRVEHPLQRALRDLPEARGRERLSARLPGRAETAVLVTIVAVGVIVMARMFTRGWSPVGDEALIEMHVRDVPNHLPLVGRVLPVRLVPTRTGVVLPAERSLPAAVVVVRWAVGRGDAPQPGGRGDVVVVGQSDRSHGRRRRAGDADRTAGGTAARDDPLTLEPVRGAGAERTPPHGRLGGCGAPGRGPVPGGSGRHRPHPGPRRQRPGGYRHARRRRRHRRGQGIRPHPPSASLASVAVRRRSGRAPLGAAGPPADRILERQPDRIVGPAPSAVVPASGWRTRSASWTAAVRPAPVVAADQPVARRMDRLPMAGPGVPGAGAGRTRRQRPFDGIRRCSVASAWLLRRTSARWSPRRRCSPPRRTRMSCWRTGEWRR